MKKMIIFDPAMCCSTGVCGPSIDENLLRVSTVINKLKKNRISIERHNLTDNPQIFVENKEINEMINNQGIDTLPVTMVDGKVVKTKEYPTNEEFCELLNLSKEYLITDDKKSEKQSSCCSGKGVSC